MDIATEGETSWKTCIVVNEDDEVQHIGGLAKCHMRPMTLHRAFSLFIFDTEGNLLLQQRAKTKYTFPLAWTNTVCSHPRNFEKSMEEWINIRVQDELGWKIKNIEKRLRAVGKLTYEAYSDATYGEKEIDTLYYLQVSEEEKKELNFNKDEVENVWWIGPEELKNHLTNGDRKLITPWFRAVYEGYCKLNQARSYEENMTAFISRTKEEEDSENDNNSTTSSPTQSSPVRREDGNQEKPWFRVGNCSMPSANEKSNHLLQAPFSFLCSNPGKLLRTQLVNMYGETDKQCSKKDIDGIASIIERTHTASLLHDDIEDKSTTRRGAVCAHRLWGVAQTINTGTYNFLLAARSVDNELAHHDEVIRSRLMREMLDTQLNLHRGQNADITWGENAMLPTGEQYLEMIDNKTGALFRSCATLPSICSGNIENGKKMGELFVEFGRFFQIRDDYANICDPNYWHAKGFYEDADEGKYSYPVLIYLQSLCKTNDQNESEWLVNRLADKETPMSQDEKLKAYEILYNAKALEKTKEYCLNKLDEIKESELFGKSSKGQALLNLLPVVDVLSPTEVSKLIKPVN